MVRNCPADCTLVSVWPNISSTGFKFHNSSAAAKAISQASQSPAWVRRVAPSMSPAP